MPGELSIAELESEFPNVEFVQEIEEGNIKQVFEANKDGEHVAFKIVTYEEGGRLEGYTEREIDIMKNTESDVLVDFIDAYDTEISGTPVYVIIEEFIEGESLKEVINNGGSCAELAVEVTDSILELLPEFDRASIVHRDIKPENIRIAESDEVRLLDVGIARMNERETLTPSIHQSGPGTPAYSAPEVLRNQRHNQDVRTDLFSTGIVFFEAMTGDHPFDHSAARRFEEAILQDQKLTLSGYIDNAELESESDRFYKRMTESEPADRYRKPGHAAEKLEDIKGILY